MRLTRIFAFLVATVVLVMAMPVDEQSLSMTDADTTTNEVEVTDMHDMTQLGDQLDEAIGVCGKVYYAVPIMSPYPIPSQNILGNDKCHDARRSFAKWQLNSNCACVFYTRVRWKGRPALGGTVPWYQRRFQVVQVPQSIGMHADSQSRFLSSTYMMSKA
ncbi:hypothetical protein BU26DRAFT_557486 [Trematosphaeria pertusa]|uniref:Uncharacterized protein n=1 Tax=Trematosphaeria pertusa TaxID=390896 RepID=A0A6A6IZY1_9PLEO|nr:uncharacterized protein BU26DRAFT_557486 [Trematosphaeria pertusa]KAF2256009.1 hypothetical protein BU26DRAFT_557486 [Trematosphaeria pertusa]